MNNTVTTPNRGAMFPSAAVLRAALRAVPARPRAVSADRAISLPSRAQFPRAAGQGAFAVTVALTGTGWARVW
jgi:hypothetical protein